MRFPHKRYSHPPTSSTTSVRVDAFAKRNELCGHSYRTEIHIASRHRHYPTCKIQSSVQLQSYEKAACCRQSKRDTVQHDDNKPKIRPRHGNRGARKWRGKGGSFTATRLRIPLLRDLVRGTCWLCWLGFHPHSLTSRAAERQSRVKRTDSIDIGVEKSSQAFPQVHWCTRFKRVHNQNTDLRAPNRPAVPCGRTCRMAVYN